MHSCMHSSYACGAKHAACQGRVGTVQLYTFRVRQDVSWVSWLRISLRSLERSLLLLSSTQSTAFWRRSSMSCSSSLLSNTIFIDQACEIQICSKEGEKKSFSWLPSSPGSPTSIFLWFNGLLLLPCPPWLSFFIRYSPEALTLGEFHDWRKHGKAWSIVESLIFRQPEVLGLILRTRGQWDWFKKVCEFKIKKGPDLPSTSLSLCLPFPHST